MSVGIVISVWWAFIQTLFFITLVMLAFRISKYSTGINHKSFFSKSISFGSNLEHHTPTPNKKTSKPSDGIDEDTNEHDDYYSFVNHKNIDKLDKLPKRASK